MPRRTHRRHVRRSINGMLVGLLSLPAAAHAQSGVTNDGRQQLRPTLAADRKDAHSRKASHPSVPGLERIAFQSLDAVRPNRWQLDAPYSDSRPAFVLAFGRDERQAGRHARRGALIGAIVGLAAGGALVAVTNDDTGRPLFRQRQTWEMLGAGVAVGTLVGGVLGWSLGR